MRIEVLCKDANFAKTMVRAQEEAAVLTLRTLSQDTAAFFTSIPMLSESAQTQDEIQAVNAAAEESAIAQESGQQVASF